MTDRLANRIQTAPRMRPQRTATKLASLLTRHLDLDPQVILRQQISDPVSPLNQADPLAVNQFSSTHVEELI